jgi:iron complex outermembrane recepter protein
MLAGKVIKYLIFTPLILMITEASGQTDSVRTIVLNSVYVTEKKPTFTSTSRQVVAMTNTEMKERGSQTLSEALSTLPGVSQLTTGAISKPVIRGLYGNRVLVNVAGLKMEDQQWEDEYGLSLSDVGVERVELIKGPASLLFGSNAMGGVVNVVEENWQEKEKNSHNFNFKLFTNTYGAGLDYGFRKSGKNLFILRAGMESHADYSDGAGNRVPNTRFALYNLKLAYIVNRLNFKSENRILASYNEFGFIADSADLKEADEEPRLSREFEDAHQKVLSTILSSINTLNLNETTEWKITIGIQNNLRREMERSEEEDLYLSLTTVSLNTSLKKQFGSHWTWTNGLAGMFQSNSNYGTRIIVPDATTAEGSAYSYAKYRHLSGKVTGNFEAGLRYDHRQIITHQTGTLNPPTSTVPPFSRGFDDVTGSVGESLNYKNLLLKFDLSSGFRSGNLAELSANGLHEGTAYWYIGNPDMKPEQCLNADLSASWQHNWLTLRGSVFRNRFRDYIYLQPTDEQINGADVFRYEQTNATLKGFETGLTVEKASIISFSVDYSYLDAKRDDGSWLPMIPANRLLFDSKFFLPVQDNDSKNAYISFGVNYTQEQDKTDAFEYSAPGYWILNAGAGVTICSVRLLLACRNLTNQLYFDHMSRLKYYGLYDMGRNIVLNVGWQF